jgi:hypothetical protein
MQADSPVVTYVYESDSYGGSHTPNIGVLHDVEAPLQPGYARSLIGPNWFGGPADTSTHYLVGPDDICQGVPENRIAWHCGTGNPRSIAVEQTGYARFSRAEWMTAYGNQQRTNIARLMADINRRRPLIQLRWLSDAQLRAAFDNPGSFGGWTYHDRMRAVIGGTTHYDPQNAPNASAAYPLNELMAEAISIRGGGGPTPPTPPTKDWFDMATEADLNRIVAAQLDARGLNGQGINDYVANVLRAPEFDLSKGKIVEHRQEDVFNAVVAVLHSPEFAGWQEVTRAAANEILSDNPKA